MSDPIADDAGEGPSSLMPAKLVEIPAGAGATVAEAARQPDATLVRKDYAEVIRGRREIIEAEVRPVLERAGERALVWEIGCGHGHFLTSYAEAHPHHVCIGVDIALDRIDRARRKRDRSALDNLHFVRAEAVLFLSALPPATIFHRVFLLFPDPWPKSRHHKHRMIQPAFLEQLARHMQPDGRLYFRTDYDPYYLEAAQTVRDHPRWRVADEVWPFEHATVFQQRAESHQSLIGQLRTEG